MCNPPVLGLEPGFDTFEVFTRASSNPGFTIDLSLYLEASGFDRNHWRTYLPLLSL